VCEEERPLREGRAREFCVLCGGRAPPPHPPWQARHVRRVATTRRAGRGGGG
jgi:hypothetical protein